MSKAPRIQHAAHELISAIQGQPPAHTREEVVPRVAFIPACTGKVSAARHACASEGYGADGSAAEDTRRVTCPECRHLMREATDPVRWDYLESKGLVKL